ncbi:hypothetical protein LIER_43333 [Lithospermum erythrorhizon]|uniref:Reverse transcriptase zinc-binding domain-containing protein n=1 Tax=Lithospermum erythrorhizon TaxID=34254 RepID=A0AAV3PXR3_LITER
MLCHGRLPTKDRLISWGMDMDKGCVLCDKEESASHLFFYCGFSREMWRKILLHIKDHRAPGKWEEELQLALRRYKGKSFQNKLRRLGLYCVIYEVWRERNSRIFGNINRDIEQIVNSCICTIRHRVCIWKVPRNKLNWNICVEWGFLWIFWYRLFSFGVPL